VYNYDIHPKANTYIRLQAALMAPNKFRNEKNAKPPNGQLKINKNGRDSIRTNPFAAGLLFNN
jgi:hypothetical protein